MYEDTLAEKYIGLVFFIVGYWFIALPYICASFICGWRSVKAAAKCGDERLIRQSKRCLIWFRIWIVLFLLIAVDAVFVHVFFDGRDVPDMVYVILMSIICQTATPLINAYFAVQLYKKRERELLEKNVNSLLFAAVPTIVLILYYA